ncbi:ribbon-helix-helix protein, CopG family [Nitrosospira sp. Nsp13]|uniref:ribbon-helix-helix protein, CopG family n=1 Tax=Nitrosospira sp. Nsp13 TaxID=1855332 RepID=UPI00088DCF35|nr:CopG family transcriptional regulator [Nitrosospira sp. Nsp13]SCY13431.1 hypothetical protein SAMN05216308_104206 [Nitrosospira sp. Nsp13]
MKQSKNADELDPQSTARASVSLSQGLHAELERMACDRTVSLACVIRDAAEKYVANQWPLLAHFK